VFERTANRIVQCQAADRIDIRRSRGWWWLLGLRVRDTSQRKGLQENDDCRDARSH
jgi:hypothetical protein